MLTVGAGLKVFLATQSVDLRRGHDGLCSLVRNQMGLDPFTGHLYVFLGRRGDRVKCVFWDRGGFVLYYKKLARGRFKLPQVPRGADRIVLDGTELAMLLGGYEVATSRRQPAWEPSVDPTPPT